MKVAIIGCGNVSTGHIAAWRDSPEAEVALLVDVERSLAEATRDQMGLPSGVRITDSFDEALSSDEVAIGDICTPSHLHAEQVIAALEAGKHVVVEKPTGYDLEECRRLRYYRRRYPEPKVAVAYSLRYYPLNIEVRRLIQDGRIGQVTSGQLTWNHPYDPDYLRQHGVPHADHLQDKGGRYIPGSEACGPTHVFDLARYLRGEPVEVFASLSDFGTYALATFMRGLDRLLLDLRLEPAFVHELLDRICQYDLATLEGMVPLAPDGVFISDDYGLQSGLMMSPDDWREFVGPRLCRLLLAAQEHGLVTMLHSCGDVSAIVPDLIRMGLDILHPVQPEAMDVFTLKREYGRDITFCGGISTQGTLPFGTPQQVSAEVLLKATELGRGGGYIFEPGITIQADVPLANLVALVETARDYRRNPGTLLGGAT